MIIRDQHRNPSNPQTGLTLVELVVVLTIMVAVAGLVVPRLQRTSDNTTEVASRANLVAVRDAVTRYWLDTKYEVLPGPPATAGSDTDTTLFANENNRFSCDGYSKTRRTIRPLLATNRLSHTTRTPVLVGTVRIFRSQPASTKSMIQMACTRQEPTFRRSMATMKARRCWDRFAVAKRVSRDPW